MVGGDGNQAETLLPPPVHAGEEIRWELNIKQSSFIKV